MAQQMCGQNAITFYQSTISKRFLGMNRKMVFLMSVVLFSWEILISPFGALSVDKAGRHKLLILSFAGMGIYMAVIGGCISQPNNHIAMHAAMAFIFLYVFFLDSHTCTAQRLLHSRPHANHGDVDGIVVVDV